MRPLRGLLACLATLVIVIILLTVRQPTTNEYNDPTNIQASRGRLRALFSFKTPDSLFPPSAIISLTDDNSTFFLARPAGYGTNLPSDGLSGQLWIGSGFDQDAVNAEGELGCSDIPGWPYSGDGSISDSKDKQKSKSGANHRNPKEITKRPTRMSKSDLGSKGDGNKDSTPSANDGTDDYLQWPLKGVPLLREAAIPQKSQNDGKDGDKGHADIQSIQESAEITGKVVLLSRGGCSFLEKTKWVQRRGGAALIVGDNLRGAPLITMYANGDATNVTIPSIFTSHTSAQLLSSLMAPGRFMEGRPIPSDLIPGAPNSKGGKGAKQQAKTEEKANQAKSGTASKGTASQGSSSGTSLWSKLVSLIGLGDDEQIPESRRYPNSGRISWVQSDDKEDDIPESKGQENKQQEAKLGSNVVKKPNGPGSNGFVIGVHDWRDPDLVALQQEENQGTSTKTTKTTSSTASVAATAKAYGDSKGKGFGGTNALPGSGRYSIPGQDGGEPRKPEKVDESEEDQEKGGWYNKLFGSEVEQLSEEEALGFERTKDAPSKPKTDSPRLPPLIDTPGPREGLWVTITPTTMSSSPFFDTLLVLVVSPLITLTVVYALLLLRARIQRRRWRAPKSVVERLPVRTYHTMSSSSTSSSTHTPSVENSSATSPLLQSDQQSTLSRTRPRSRTTTDVAEGPALTLERQREDLASRYEKKKYRGRQIECAVCLEEYVDGQSQVMSLPCGHEFHAECITPWLTTRRRTCPICKGDVVRNLAASSSEDMRSASSSPARGPSRTHSLDRRSGTPHSDTPLLRRQTDDLERGRSRNRSPGGGSWGSFWGWNLRFWERRRGNDDTIDRDR